MLLKFSIKYSGILLLILILGGCQEVFDIRAEIVDGGEVTFIFRANGTEAEGFPILNFAVIEEDRNGQPGKMVWSVVSADKERQLQTRIRYGSLPKGFETLVSAKNLEPGKSYQCISIMPGKSAGCRFKAR